MVRVGAQVLSAVSPLKDWLGVPLWATRKVRLMHVGQGYFPNFQEWGTETRDEGTEVF